MFVCLQVIGFAALAADFLFRFGLNLVKSNRSVMKAFLPALLTFGSDAVDGPVFNFFIAIYSVLTFVILLISLFLVNSLDTPVLRDLRSAHGGIVVQGVTTMACLAFFMRFVIGFLIATKMEVEDELPAVVAARANLKAAHANLNAALALKTSSLSKEQAWLDAAQAASRAAQTNLEVAKKVAKVTGNAAAFAGSQYTPVSLNEVEVEVGDVEKGQGLGKQAKQEEKEQQQKEEGCCIC
jgi:hypothetical protein